MVQPHGPHGKYCSDHCQQAGDKIEFRCDCQHPPAARGPESAFGTVWKQRSTTASVRVRMSQTTVYDTCGSATAVALVGWVFRS